MQVVSIHTSTFKSYSGFQDWKSVFAGSKWSHSFLLIFFKKSTIENSQWVSTNVSPVHVICCFGHQDQFTGLEIIVSYISGWVIFTIHTLFLDINVQRQWEEKTEGWWNYISRLGQNVCIWGFKYHPRRNRLRCNLIGKMSLPPILDQSWITTEKQNDPYKGIISHWARGNLKLTGFLFKTDFSLTLKVKTKTTKTCLLQIDHIQNLESTVRIPLKYYLKSNVFMKAAIWRPDGPEENPPEQCGQRTLLFFSYVSILLGRSPTDLQIMLQRIHFSWGIKVLVSNNSSLLNQ